MEQAQHRNSTKDHMQRHRRSKAKHSPQVANENKNPAALMQSMCQPAPSPLLSGNEKKDSVLQNSEEGRIVKVEMEEKMLKKKLKAHPEIPGLNLEKSAKDLQRCSVSISRYREMVKEEVEISVRNIKSTFTELYKSLIDREAQLMLEVEKLKCEALENLLARERKAEELRRFTEFSSQRTDIQMVELRSQIKHFVSERKYDEELLKTARVSYDAEELKRQILTCGEISHPKNSYSARQECNQMFSFETDNITETNPKTQCEHMQKPAHNRKSYAESTKIANAVSKEPLDSANLSACITKQRAGHSQQRNPAPKFQRVRLKEQTEHVKMEEAAQSCNAVSTNEKIRGQHYTRRNKYRRGLHNNEPPSAEDNTKHRRDERQVGKRTPPQSGSFSSSPKS